MTTPAIPLAEGFPSATRADWLSLVARTLKGAGSESLAGRTADGLPVMPLYGAEDGGRPANFTPAARVGEAGWDVRAAVVTGDPASANRAALEALAGGAASLLFRIGVGAGDGVDIASPADLARVLRGVVTDLAPVAIDAGFGGPIAAGWLDAVAKASPSAPLAFHLDPFTSFAQAGASPGPIADHVRAAASAATKLAETYPRAGLFLASGASVHEAGGTAAWELAFAAAATVSYAKALVAQGLPIDGAFARLVVGVVVDAEPLGAIAKLRAARVLWTRITGACGVAVPCIIEARASRRMLTRADRWTNLVRLTSAGFGAAVGGADAIVLGAFTDAIGAPDAFALRMARNTQLILMEEAHLGRVADPAAGSWAMEAQTSDLAHAAWDAFIAIEKAGGLAAALEDGLVADAVERGRAALAAALGNKALRLIGVTDFQSGEPTSTATDAAAHEPWAVDVRRPGPDSLCRPLTPVRLEELAQ